MNSSMAQAMASEQMGNQLLQAAKIVEEQLDSEIQRLDNMDEDELELIREKRKKQMQKQQKQKQEWMSMGHGEYTEVANEPEFFDACKKSTRVVCHFYRDSTFRCKIVDKHLRLLAAKHVETRFITANVDKVPFLVKRLNIRIIPTIALVKDAKTESYIRGFDDLGGHDEFSTEMLEWRLGVGKIISYAGDLSTPPDSKPKKQTVVSRKNLRDKDDSDSGDDW